MKNRCQHAVFQALLDIIDIAANANAALRLPLNTEKKRHHAEDSPLRRRQFNERRQQGAAADILRRCFAIGASCPFSRRYEDCEQPSSESSLTRHRKIQLALGLSFEERPGRVGAAAPVKTQQNVIMAVEDRHAPRRCHQRCSVAETFKMRSLPDRRLGVPFGERAVWKSTHPPRTAEART